MACDVSLRLTGSAQSAGGLDLTPLGGDGFLIGELARGSGVSRRDLRLYEARGILPPPLLPPSGYRTDVAQVQVWCAFVEVVLGEASFTKALAPRTSH